MWSSARDQDKIIPAIMTHQPRRIDEKKATVLQFTLPATALLALVLAQWLIVRRESAAMGALLALPALAILLVSLLADQTPPDPAQSIKSLRSERPLVQSRLWRSVFGATALLLALRAFAGFEGNDLAGGFWYWLGAILYSWLAVASVPALRPTWVPAAIGLAFVGVTMVGILFRFHQLALVPPEMTSDHAEKLLDVHDVLLGWRPTFFPRNTGREMIQFYLTAVIIRLSGLPVGYLALKVGTAMIGVVAVPATFFLGRELFGGLAGTYAAFFVAVSHWHVAISRVGLRFPLTPAFATPALFYLLRALRTNRRNDWIAAGLLLGLGLHGYTAMRVVPLLFVLLVLIKVGADAAAARRGLRVEETSGLTTAFWLNATVATALAVLAFLPLLRFMLEEPQLAWYRTASRAQASVTEVWPILWLNIKNALLMFNYRGDVVPANTIPESPQLGTVSAALLLAGVPYILWRLVVRRERPAAYTLISLALLLLPSILSLAYPGENPSAVRAGGAVPVVMIIAALPLADLTAKWWRNVPVRSFAVLLIAGLLLFSALENADWYFNRYKAHTLLSSWNTSEMGAVARAFAEETGSLDTVYHIPYPHWVDTRNIGINAGDVTWENAVLDLDQISRHAEDPAPKLYFVYPGDEDALRYLRSIYADGQLERFDSTRPGKDFFIFRVGRR